MSLGEVVRVRTPPTLAFVAAAGLSAALLFSIQPIFGRMLTPRMGGATAVWTTAMLFFQTALLAGYAWAHLLARRLSPRAQGIAHLAVTAAGLLALPVAIPPDWRMDPEAPATLQTLGLLAVCVGAPFFALSANAPLLQSWWAAARGPGGGEPYGLYAASNAGSAAALLGYALLAEPLAGAAATSRAWVWGYVALALLLAVCAQAAASGAPSAPAHRAAPRVPAGRLIGWAATAFLPSSLLLGVTQIATTDYGAFPLLWIAPLALYLLSFTVAFSERLPLSAAALGRRALLVGSGALMVMLLAGSKAATVPALALLFGGFFAVATALHRKLYEDRPPADGLTAFYLALAAGGAAGGAFNALAAPLLFDTLAEAPLALAAAGLALAGRDLRRDRGRGALADLRGGLAWASAAGLCWLAAGWAGATGPLALAFPAAAALALLVSRPGAHAVAALVMTAAATIPPGSETVVRSRSFFGAYRVADDAGSGRRLFLHGTTLHGAQWLAELGGRPTSLGYYHPAGPIGSTLGALPDAARVAVVGLGVGAVACHAKPGQDWTFHEIDPEVARIARDPTLFGYMATCGAGAPVLLGDARITLARTPPGALDALLIDAYSSDAVPLHLMTLEALDLYRSRLAPGGVLLLHLSHRHLDLARMVGRAAAASGLSARLCVRGRADPLAHGETPSVVALLAEDDATVARRAAGPCWRPLPSDGGRVWTDDAASLLDALK
jgi:hypothetical protein